ncbi:MAG TPA: site-specific DNA-methyltransferase [Gemmataceae bacterium]|jgi:DNA modification methylase
MRWNQFLVEDARKLGGLLGDEPVIDVTVTSPPYWDLKNYGTENQIGYRQTLDQYLTDLVTVFSAVWRCTKATGSLWLVMKSLKKDGVLHMLPFQLADRLTAHPKHAWHLQDVLIWHKPHTLPWSRKEKLQDNFEYILCLSKSRKFKLDIEALRSPQGITNWWVKYPERYHPRGKALSNVWEIAIPTQGSWGNGDLDHFCPLPPELVKRVILLSTKKGGMVCDPFAGTGTTVLAAEELGRRWLALDVNPRFRDMFRRRKQERADPVRRNGVASLADANLRLRQLKFAIVLYKRMTPGLRLTAEQVPLLAVLGGKSQRTAAPFWVTGCRVVVAIADKHYRAKKRVIADAAAALCDKPPLSKFQVDATVEVTRHSDAVAVLAGKKLFLYSGGAFWHHASTVSDVAALEPRSGIPPVVSDVCVTERPAY